MTTQASESSSSSAPKGTKAVAMADAQSDSEYNYYASSSDDLLRASSTPTDASSSQREYGTFDVSVIDMESAKSGDQVSKSHHHDDDCCCVVSWFIRLPFRLHTYKTLVFHLASLAFAAATALWTLVLVAVRLVVVRNRTPPALWKRIECGSLRLALETDCCLMNWISPSHERVMVYELLPVNARLQGYMQWYYGGLKLVASAVPSLLSTAMFVWSLAQVCGLVAGHHAHSAVWVDEDYDLVLLAAVVVVYVAAVLMHMLASLSRHVTIFFCADYLLYVM